MEMISENLWITWIASLVYFSPTLIAFQKKNMIQIFILNFFTGITVFGWIISLGMALTPDNPVEKTIQENTAQPNNEELYKDKLANARNLYDQGFLTLNQISEIENEILNRK